MKEGKFNFLPVLYLMRAIDSRTNQFEQGWATHFVRLSLGEFSGNAHNNCASALDPEA